MASEPWKEIEGLTASTASFKLKLPPAAERRETVDAALWQCTGLAELDLSGVGLRWLHAHPVDPPETAAAAEACDEPGEGESDGEASGSGASGGSNTDAAADAEAMDAMAGVPLQSGLRRLTNLRDLSLGDNSLGPVLLPEGALHGLTSLRSLDLQGNALQSLPPAIISLVALQSLNVGRNQLPELPWTSLSLLPALRLVSAPYNAMGGAAIPPGAELPSTLRELSFRGNALTEDWGLAALGKLQILSSVDLAENALTALPQELALGCPKLSRLDISGNPFVDKKLAKLAEGQSDQAPAKPILEILRKGQSRRQMKAEIASKPKSRRKPPRLYVPAACKADASEAAEVATPAASKKAAGGKKAKKKAAPAPTPAAPATTAPPRKSVRVSRDVLAVRPHLLMALLHVVVDDEEADAGSDDSGPDSPRRAPHFFFAEGSASDTPQKEFEEAFEAQVGLMERGLGEGGDSEANGVAAAAHAAAARLREFVAAQTQIHAAPTLGNKRRAGSLGAHNAEMVKWPLRYHAAPHDVVQFSPLSIGWMEGKGRMSAATFAAQVIGGRAAGHSKAQAAALQPFAAMLLSMPLCPHVVDADGTVLSVHPLSNGWETRNTPDARGAVLLECSSASSEAVCRRMLLELIQQAIRLVEGGRADGVRKRCVRVLVEPVDVVCEWDTKLRRADFPSDEELLTLPALPDYCGATARDDQSGSGSDSD